MRVRIVCPLPDELDGIALTQLAFQGSYDLRKPLAELLVAKGYAIREQRMATAVAGPPLTPARKRRQRSA